MNCSKREDEHFLYCKICISSFNCYTTTNPNERSAADTKRSTSVIQNHLQNPTERSPSESVEHSASARWDSSGDSKSLSLVERSMAVAERSVGLVVQHFNIATFACFGTPCKVAILKVQYLFCAAWKELSKDT